MCTLSNRLYCHRVCHQWGDEQVVAGKVRRAYINAEVVAGVQVGPMVLASIILFFVCL